MGSVQVGLSDEVVRAEAIDETDWHMNNESDYEPRSAGHCALGDNRDPCPTSFGILQIKWYYNPDTNRANSSYPWSKNMTAFSLDYTLAWLRGCYEGWQYFGAESRGDLWGCLGVRGTREAGATAALSITSAACRASTTANPGGAGNPHGPSPCRPLR